MATPTSRIRVALCALLLLGLPGCANLPRFALTQEVWAKDEEPTVEWQASAADLGVALASDPERPGALSVQAQRVDDEPMPIASGLAGKHSRWQLTPEQDAAEALWMLTAADCFTVHRARIDVHRDYRDGDIVCSDADLRLDVGVDWSVLATRVDAATLARATRKEPLRPRRNDLGEAAHERPRPDLLTQCADRLADLDLSPLLPGAGHVELESWTWVDENDVVVDRARVEELCGKKLDDPKMPLADRLARLAKLRLLVVVVTGTTRASFSLRPDYVWLFAGMEPDGNGGSVHRSRWHARPVAPLAAGPHEPPPLAAGTMRLHMFGGYYPDHTLQNVVAAVVKTPFSVVADLFLWMAGLDIPVDKKPQRPGRDWR